MDDLDEKIISVLKYGNKKQVEIVTLLDTEKSERTIRNHITKLEDNGVIEREGDRGPYYLPSYQDMVPPQPFADQERVSQLLHNIEEELETNRDKTEASSQQSSVISQVESNLFSSPNDDPRSNDENMRGIESQTDLIDFMAEFYNITGSSHYVLGNEDNLDHYFRVFDRVLDIIEDAESDDAVMTFSEKSFEIFFLLTGDIHDNWDAGKENEKFHKRMDKRAERMFSLFDSFETGSYPYLRSLLGDISKEYGQKAYISMVESRNYDHDRLLSEAFYTYDIFNEINQLFNDLNDVQRRANDEETTKEISQLKDDIRRLYKQETRNTT